MARHRNKHKQSSTHLTSAHLKRKVFVAMSGGVDSSVAAALLVRAGYEVTGVFMINYDEMSDCHSDRRSPEATVVEESLDHCGMGQEIPRLRRGSARDDNMERCWTFDYRDAVRVAAHLGIPLLKLNFTKEYKKFVLDYMYKEYESGRTPNPDVLCNKFVKFGAWLEKARELGFDKLATGHYARLEAEIRNSKFAFLERSEKIRNKSQNSKSKIKLISSKDTDKDQTYFLHQLTQDQLRHVLFPIGDYTKKEVRAMAKKWGLPTADKEESMGICFIGEVPMKEFLMKKIKPRIGDIMLSSGEVVGQHEGVAFYTTGQRIGVKNPKSKIQMSNQIQNPNVKSLFVVDKIVSANTLVVGYDDDSLLYKKETDVTGINWIAGRPPKFPLQCEVRLRHRQPLQKCTINVGARGLSPTHVKFAKPQRAVTPGQFAVFYKKSECLGGGVIE